jgi:ATP/maltotriose-dependent transcriptional regulator MalT
MLRDILLNHAWGMFNHSELGCWSSPGGAAVVKPAGKPACLLQAWLMQSQHRYSEVNTLLARAEQEMDEMDTAMHGDFNALRAQVAINAAIRTKPNVWRWWPWMSCRWPTTTAASLPHRYTAKCCTAKAS